MERDTWVMVSPKIKPSPSRRVDKSPSSSKVSKTRVRSATFLPRLSLISCRISPELVKPYRAFCSWQRLS